MAKVTFGLVITEARGKAGEVCYSRTRGGAYIRKTPYYVQPITPDVAAVRAIMKVVGAMWSNTLTEGQRVSWRAFARGLTWKDVLNQNVVPAGQDLFTQCNFNNANVRGAYILNPPLRLMATDPGALTLAASASAQTLTLTPTNPLPANYAPLIMATTALNPGWQFYNKFLRQLRGGTYTSWQDTFAGTHPVPPWVASPYYTPSLWNETSNVLGVSPAANLEDIYSPTQRTDMHITCIITWGTNNQYSGGVTARVNPTTGARYAVLPGSNFTLLRLVYLPVFGSNAGELFLANTPYTYGTAPNALDWQISGSTHTLKMNGTTVITYTDTTLNAGACGIMANILSPFYVANYAVTATATTPTLPNIAPQYIAKFGTLTAGKRIGASLAYINLLTGAKSPTQSQSCVVAA